MPVRSFSSEFHVVFNWLFGGSPLSAYWDINPQYSYSCVDIGILTLICGILNILTDFVCLFLPLPIIWNIQRPKKQRLLILVMFAVGFLTCMAGIIRTIYADIALRKTYDMTWWLFPLHFTTALEIDIGLVSHPLVCYRNIQNIWLNTHYSKSVRPSRHSAPYFSIASPMITREIKFQTKLIVVPLHEG